MIADPDMGEQTKADMAAWTGCIAGALTEAEFRQALAAVGFEGIDIRRTHKVHEHASSAIIRAHKSAMTDCCRTETQTTCCEPADKADCCGAAQTPVACGCESAPDAPAS